MLLACLVLGVVAPAAASTPRVDESGWIASRHAVAGAAVTRRATARKRAPMPAPRVAAPGRRAVLRAPARARARVVHRRVYQRHVSLLR
jgi:hypothetical protein